MALIRFGNPNTASVLTVITNVVDARRALTVMVVDRTTTLTAVEAQDFLDWLYQQRDAIFALAHADESDVEQGA